MKLHYSQTWQLLPPLYLGFSTLWNYTTLKQRVYTNFACKGFSTLWNYTTLKRCIVVYITRPVSVPYEITLLSNKLRKHCGETISFSTLWNYTTLKQLRNPKKYGYVSVPYEITLLSNIQIHFNFSARFQYLMKLHYSQTDFLHISTSFMFQYLMKLHYSQTSEGASEQYNGFQYLMKLHYSQT